MAKTKPKKPKTVKNEKPKAKRRGDGSLYSEALIDRMCSEIETSEKGLHAICKNPDYPSVSLFMRWLSDGKHPFAVERYTRAKQLQAEYMEEQLLKIADDSSEDAIMTEKGIIENKEFVNRSRLRVDTRKWLMAKLMPKKYGDKLDVTSDGKQINQAVVVATPEVAKDVDSLEG